MCFWVKGESARPQIKEVRAATPDIILEKARKHRGMVGRHSNGPIQWPSTFEIIEVGKQTLLFTLD